MFTRKRLLVKRPPSGSTSCASSRGWRSAPRSSRSGWWPATFASSCTPGLAGATPRPRWTSRPSSTTAQGVR
eukprot:10369714-Alexandrium_andersonii.AAC.1